MITKIRPLPKKLFIEIGSHLADLMHFAHPKTLPFALFDGTVILELVGESYRFWQRLIQTNED